MNNTILLKLQLCLKMSPFLCDNKDSFLTFARSIDEKQNIKGIVKETKRNFSEKKIILFPHKSVLEEYKH